MTWHEDVMPWLGWSKLTPLPSQPCFLRQNGWVMLSMGPFPSMLPYACCPPMSSKMAYMFWNFLGAWAWESYGLPSLQVIKCGATLTLIVMQPAGISPTQSWPSFRSNIQFSCHRQQSTDLIRGSPNLSQRSALSY